jgi:hypothetical protein
MLIFAIVWRKAFWARIRVTSAYYPHTYTSGFSSIAFWIFAAAATAIGVIQMIGFF